MAIAQLIRVSHGITDCALDPLRLCQRGKPAQGRSVPVDEKLREIPLHAFAEDAGQAGGQPAKQRVSASTLDVRLFKHGKADTIVEEALVPDGGGISRLLIAELVAGETQNHEPPVLVFPVQVFKARILGRETAFARGVDDQDSFAREALQRDLLTLQRARAELIEFAHGASFEHWQLSTTPCRPLRTTAMPRTTSARYKSLLTRDLLVAIPHRLDLTDRCPCTLSVVDVISSPGVPAFDPNIAVIAHSGDIFACFKSHRIFSRASRAIAGLGIGSEVAHHTARLVRRPGCARTGIGRVQCPANRHVSRVVWSNSRSAAC